MVDISERPEPLVVQNLSEDVAKQFGKASQDLAIARRNLVGRVTDYLNNRMMHSGVTYPREHQLLDAMMEYIWHVGAKGVKSGLSSNGSSLPLSKYDPERLFAEIVLSLNIGKDSTDLLISKLDAAAERLVRSAEVVDAILAEASGSSVD